MCAIECKFKSSSARKSRVHSIRDSKTLQQRVVGIIPDCMTVEKLLIIEIQYNWTFKIILKLQS